MPEPGNARVDILALPSGRASEYAGRPLQVGPRFVAHPLKGRRVGGWGRSAVGGTALAPLAGLTLALTGALILLVLTGRGAVVSVT